MLRVKITVYIMNPCVTPNLNFWNSDEGVKFIF